MELLTASERLLFGADIGIGIVVLILLLVYLFAPYDPPGGW